MIEGTAQSDGSLIGGPDVAIAQVRDDEPCHADQPTETDFENLSASGFCTTCSAAAPSAIAGACLAAPKANAVVIAFGIV